MSVLKVSAHRRCGTPRYQDERDSLLHVSSAGKEVATRARGTFPPVHAPAILHRHSPHRRAPERRRPRGGGACPATDSLGRAQRCRGAAAGAFQAVVAKSVSLKAADRYADGRALRDALRSAARTELGETHPSPSARVTPHRRRPLMAPGAPRALCSTPHRSSSCRTCPPGGPARRSAKSGLGSESARHAATACADLASPRFA